MFTIIRFKPLLHDVEREILSGVKTAEPWRFRLQQLLSVVGRVCAVMTFAVLATTMLVDLYLTYRLGLPPSAVHGVERQCAIVSCVCITIAVVASIVHDVLWNDLQPAVRDAAQQVRAPAR